MQDLIITSNELVPEKIFTPGGTDRIISEIKSKVYEYELSIETKEKRKEVASIARKIASSKIFIDNMGKEFAKDVKAKYKAIIDPIDSERKKCRDELDALKEEVRRPLTEYEAEQKRLEEEELKRIADIQAAEELRKEIESAHADAIAENELFDRRKEIELKEKELAKIAAEQEAEKERVRIEKEQSEREERIRIEAKERAEREAKERIERERTEAERIVIEAKEREERLKREAIEREERLKNEAAAREAKIKYEAEQAQKHALEQQRIEAEKIEKEKHRIESERIRLEQEKAANVEHQRAINIEILNSFVTFGIPSETCKLLITAIASGNVNHVKIMY